MPGALRKRHELDHAAVAANQQVCRYLDAANLRVIRMGFPVERIREQRFDLGAAELTGRQADAVQDDQGRLDARRAGVAVGARVPARGLEQAGGFVDGERA